MDSGATLKVSEGEFTSVSVTGFPTDWSDLDVQYWAEQLAANGDKVAQRACALVGAHWIDMCTTAYVAGQRIHQRTRVYVDA